MSDNINCPPLEGNSDLYGLGIRIGIYLQWISTWIVTVVNPSEIQSAYDVNSAFVFAVVIATIVARDTSRPIETYIMLQIAMGFFITTLSTFGVRPQLATPTKLRGLGSQLLSALKDTADIFREFISEHESALPQALTFPQRLLNYTIVLMLKPIKIPLAFFSPLKPSDMAWSGVLWRTAVAGIIAGFNIHFWFGTSLNANPCDQNIVFLFSKQRLTGPVVEFFQAGAIITAIFIFVPASFLVLLTWNLGVFSYGMIYRQLYLNTNPVLPKTFQTILRKIDQHDYMRFVARYQIGGFYSFLFPAQFRSIYDILEFYAGAAENPVTLQNIVEATIALFSGQVQVTKTSPESGDAQDLPPILQQFLLSFCTMFNILVISSIAWFILSIELTLKWNNIQGVHTIQTTGQLIPFIIGCVSMAQVCKKVALIAMREAFPGWKEVSWEAEMASGNQIIFSIKKNDSRSHNDPLVTAIGTPLPPSPVP